MKRILITLLVLVSLSRAGAQTLNTPSLISPVNNALNQSPDALLDWGAVTNATTYEVHYGTDPALTSFSVFNVSSSQVNCSNLLFGTTYYWQVKARSATDSSNWSVIWNFKTLDTLYLVAPVNGAINQSPDVLLDWSVVSGISGYQIQTDTIAGFSSPALQSSVVSGTSQVNTSNLRFGQTYFWRVRAFHGIDTTGWSETRSFSTLDTIYHVSPVNGATGQSPDVLLDWSVVSGINGYQIQVDTVSGFSSPALQNNTISGSSQFSASNLRFGTQYFWRVRAYHSSDTTRWSAFWSFTTLDTIYHVAPVNGASNQAPDVLLDWSAVSGINGYIVQYDTTNSFNSTLLNSTTIGATSQFSTSNLRFGTRYYWRVRAFHAVDTTKWTTPWTFTTTDTLYLVSPVNGATNQTPDALLDWSAISGINGYQVMYDTSASFNSPQLSSTNIGATSQFTTSNLLFGQTYYWKARAIHPTDTSGWSATWSFRVLDVLVQVAPVNGAISQTPDVLTDWSGISGITGYQVQLDTNNTFTSPGFVSITLGATSQATTSNLYFGTTYHWRVRAFHPADTSAWSSAWIFRTLDTLTLLTPVNNAINQPLNLTLDWSGITGITGYEAQLSSDSLFANPSSFIATSSQQAVTNLSYGTRYFWRVRAFHLNDTSGWGNTWKFETIFQINSVPFLSFPNNGSLNAPIADTLKWLQVNDPLITGYEIQLDDNNVFSSPVILYTNDTVTPYSGLNWNTTYYWRARCKNGSGNGPWSSTWSFTTLLNVGIEEPEQANVIAYPNPASAGQAIQLFPNGVQIAAYELFTADGKKVAHSAFAGTINTFIIRVDKPGLYLLRVFDQQEKLTDTIKMMIR